MTQANPDDTGGLFLNAALAVTNSDIVLAGTNSAGSKTMLISDDRATTLLSVGSDQANHSFFVTNFSLRDITLVGQPHLAARTNTSAPYGYTNQYAIGQLDAIPSGCLVSLSKNLWCYDILISNCVFLNSIQTIVPNSLVSNLMIRDCMFVPWNETNSFDRTTNSNDPSHTVPWAFNEAAIYGSADNVVIIENGYNGNSILAPTNSNIYGYINTNSAQQCAQDGFIWLQYGGNNFIAQNSISNWEVEAVQLNSGPTAVVANRYYSLIDGRASCALCAYGGDAGLSGTSADYSTCFVGNWIYGGRAGEGNVNDPVGPFTLTFSGNFAALFPPFAQAGDFPGAMVSVSDSKYCNILGNTLAAGGRGFFFGAKCQNALLLANDLRNVSYSGMSWLGSAFSDAVNVASVFGNQLGEGSTFHLQLQPSNTFGWFLKGNSYFSGNAIVPAFVDPAATSIHLNQ